MSLLNNYDVIIVDAYGVFKFGQGISKSVIGVFRTLINAGKQVYVLSNTTANNEETINSYSRGGMIKGIHYTDLLTSGQFAKEDIQSGNLPIAGKKYYVFGTANFKKLDPVPAIFANSSYELVTNTDDADFIYCGIPQLLDDEGCPYDSTEVSDFIIQVAKLVKTGLPLVCANPDLVANEGGRFVVRQGTIAKLWEDCYGKVVMYGKPDPKIFDALIARYCPSVPKSKIIMVGDTLRTDIKGARLAGIDTMLVVEGGVTEYEMKRENLSLSEYLLKEVSKEGIRGHIDVYTQIPFEPLF